MSYSLYETVQDRSVTAKRWFHHLGVKHATQHVLPTFWLTALTHRPLLAAFIGGPGVYAYILAHKLWTRAPRNRADWLCDATFAVACIAGALLLQGDTPGGLWLLGACVSTWWALHTRATP